MVPLTAVVLAAAASALYFYFTRNFNYWKHRNISGPKPVPFFGNIFESALRCVTIGEIFKKIYNNYPTEKVVGVFRMTSPCLLIRDLDIVKHVMIKDFDNFVDRGIEFSKEGLGQNLFHSDGETWRALRNRFSPIFTSQKLKNMMHLLNDGADKFVDYLSGITATNHEHNVHKLVQKYTLSTFTTCFFGLDFDTFRKDIPTLKRIDNAMFSLSFAMELDMLYPGILKKLNLSTFPEYMKKFFKNLVTTAINDRNGVPSDRKDFIDLILELKDKQTLQTTKKFSVEDAKAIEITNSIIEAQVFVFYSAGYETTASTMAFTLYHLSQESAIQDILRNEIEEYLRRHDNRIELDTLNELIYLDQVFNETLRMYPVVETTQRKAQNDYECPGTNVKVAKDQIVIIPVMGIHRDEKYYPDPDKFNPDNFASEKVAGRHSCAHLPFGLGPRHCIGMRFAQLQYRVCMIRLLSRFQVVAGQNTVRSITFDPYRIIVTPKESIYVNIYPRDL